MSKEQKFFICRHCGNLIGMIFNQGVPTVCCGEKMEELVPKIIKIYFTYGIKSVTMDDLASELGISKKTLYQHFSDKAMVIDSCVDFLLSKHEERLSVPSKRETNNAIDKMLETTAFIFAHDRAMNPSVKFDLQKYYPEIWVKIESFTSETFFNFLNEILKQGIEEGLFENDIDIEVVSRIFINVVDFLACKKNTFFGNRDS
ncbi:MAG: TetR family transcriptional regulator, partial [Candidatus Moranbacteria bacterium]|nr:TetR family transcriptional regulator [Candidatus Moranbacteria bacterium]